MGISKSQHTQLKWLNDDNLYPEFGNLYVH